MTLPKTRCKQCAHANEKANKEPCNKCAEIQFGLKNFDNHFLAANKNLLKED